MADGRTIYIAGAGIAGLTLALALAKFGATVVVLERAKVPSEIGAGIQISPNARRVLNQLGLDKAIAAKSLEPSGIDIYPFRSKKPLVTLELGMAVRKRFRAPYAVMHRADLAEILFKACRRFANIDILFGVRSFDAISHAKGVSVVAEETGGNGRNARAFAFIGADGVNSATRQQVMQGPSAEYRGYAVWRALIDFESMKGLIAEDRVSLLMGPGYHAVCYPVPHRKRFNIALFAREKHLTATGGKAPKGPRLPWAALPSQRFDAIIKAAAETWGLWPVSTVSAPSWSSGGIGLIGDAAHAMFPFQAQGAAMAIEDAAILAPLLMTEPSAESALARYEALRRPRVSRVARVSAANGEVFHWEWPFTLGRDLVILAQGARGHFRRLNWLYSYDASPEVETAGRLRGN